MQFKLLGAGSLSDLTLHASASTGPGTQYAANSYQDNEKASQKSYHLPVCSTEDPGSSLVFLSV